MKNTYFILIAFVLSPLLYLNAQGLLSENTNFTKQDTIRGSITPERAWWDLTYYHLDIKVDPENKFISGKNTITYKVLKSDSIMQIDLQSPMKLLKAIQNGKELKVRHEGNAHFISLVENQNIDDINSVEVYYEGHPREAVNAPWDGGISWKKDKNGKDFIASSCQGLGASVWWPCKDHMYDEVEGMKISVNVPSHLTNVSNGRLILVERIGDTKTFHWEVKSPINNYGVNINIGDYANFSEVYDGQGGNLDLDYYVLSYNLEKAKEQFKQVPMMLKAFEHWFGQYPFYRDSFKLVEAPYLGMEHQSSVTYGNGYQNGYLGNDLSGTGWGLKFDFIIIHESGHEWFANNITNKDIADMWIHESFTAYSESLYLDYHFGKEAGAEYVIGTRANIQNDSPLIGQYNVNNEGSGDMYYKGANMLHTLRQLVKDDDVWRKILHKMNVKFYHQTVTTQQIENFLSYETTIDLSAFFNQYLRTTKIPVLEYSINKKVLKYRWTNCVEGFEMPIQIKINDEDQWISPKAEWNTLTLDSKIENIEVDIDFYVETKKI
ncbi:M1 family metallopeptidase [Algibacter amylolyticus]|uniref:M1 family metallopeptidase n=1 Tax=Algibacter amylolyticus TaxID=1608400 RepID=A0A5M7B7W2_9FLAO|nr:M1 family metallopeptidase [Algibacter amylolyticus]KAA5823475.1 M1 family metallopeptidase [Algibacter amylolyticus]MBB5267625.1 aminopeptidase N [Algibacter amylolyticus]TSJ73963.1 M1 family metallopeptidase [Algibacter amylolyticus]